MNVKEYLQEVKSGRIDVVRYVENILEEAKKINVGYSYFNFIAEENAVKHAEEVRKKIVKKNSGRLAGLCVSAKDNICVKGIESTAGSMILNGYKPLFNATAIEGEEDAKKPS